MATYQPQKSAAPCKNGRFENKWNEWPFGIMDGPVKFCKWIAALASTQYHRPNLDKDLPIMKPYFLDGKDVDDEIDKIRATWLGHASVLVEIDGFKVLCDPIFSNKCPPYVGPSRYRDVPCKVTDLPKIDAVLISHNHYDHMDSDTIKKLYSENNQIQWFIPQGDKYNLEKMLGPVKKCKEMKWYDEYDLAKKCKNEERHLKICFTPTQHWSNRGIFDSFKSLWGSWTLIGSTHRFWFGGDTGYCEAFEEIGNNYGPFDGAAIPIGAYKPRDLVKFQHVNPEEALRIHKDIKSKVSFGIHWGTFQLTSESYMEPKELLEELVKNDGIITNFFTLNHGETLEIIGDQFKKLECEKREQVTQLSYLMWFLSIITHFFRRDINYDSRRHSYQEKKNEKESLNPYSNEMRRD